MPPAFTAQAHQLLGPDKLLVVGLSVIAEGERDRAREALSILLGSPSYAATVARLGYSVPEIAHVSDRLVDDAVAHGGPDAIAAKVREHLAAGADHVELMLPNGDFTLGISQFERLAPALAGVG